jgi:hypothetical protein
MNEPTQTPAQQKALQVREQKKVIRNRYGDFIPKGGDPIKLYRQWKASIFAQPEDADDEVMFLC